jgi:hypothetical protein
MCLFARGVTFDSEVLEKLVDRHLTARQTNNPDIIQALLSSLQKHNLEVSKLVDIVTDCYPCITGLQVACVSFYKNLCDLVLKNELIYH